MRSSPMRSISASVLRGTSSPLLFLCGSWLSSPKSPSFFPGVVVLGFVDVGAAGGLTSCTGGLGCCAGGLTSCTGGLGCCAGGLTSCTGGFGCCTGGLGCCAGGLTSCTE